MDRAVKKFILCSFIAFICALCYSVGLHTGKHDVIVNQSIVSSSLVEYDGNLYEYD